MLYSLYDAHHRALAPMRLVARSTRMMFSNPWMPMAHTRVGRAVAAGADMLEGAIRRYGRPDWNLDPVVIDGVHRQVGIRTVMEQPFCRLVRFDRGLPDGTGAESRHRPDPKVLLVAPMSGHYATLLRGTVQALLPAHDVYITDWLDARMVPLAAGAFRLDDYVSCLNQFMRRLAPDLTVIAVCQPAPLVLASVSLLAGWNDPGRPRGMVLMGGPVDCRAAPTDVTRLADRTTLTAFRRRAITQVPAGYPGAFRWVYPGFLQLGAFMSMNPSRHLDAHLRYFNHLVEGDGDSADAHRKFYDEYLSVMDVPADYFLDTLESVFKEHRIASGTMTWRGQAVDPGAITDVALLTVEGELDDISAPGQTVAAHGLCRNLPAALQDDLMVPGVGHYGIFNGRRWRDTICPHIAAFIRRHRDPATGTRWPGMRWPGMRLGLSRQTRKAV